MEVINSKNYILVSIDKDMSVVSTLTDICKTFNIKNGQISGIGAVKEIELGSYDIITKSYYKKYLSEIYELISLQGNITLKDNEPFIHAHIALGNHELEMCGGHLFEMKIGVAGEFIINKINSNIFRKFNKNIGLPTWCSKGNEQTEIY